MQYKTQVIPRQATLVKVLWVGAALALGLLVAAWGVRSWLVVSFPFQVEYGEGPVLDWAMMLRAGTWPYKPIQPAPWTFSVYTPGYLLAAAAVTPIVEFVGASVWVGGRLISLVSAFGLAGIAAVLVSDEVDSRWAGWLAPGLWLASPYLTRWATFYRPDLFALFWSAVGTLLVIKCKGRMGMMALAALAFVAGFYTKQSFFAAPLAAVLYLLWRDRRSALVLGSVGAAAGILVAVLLWFSTDGVAYQSLVVGNANPFDMQALLDFETAFLRTVPIILLLAVATLRRRLDLIGVWFVLALLVTISAGKAGAWENYFLEPLFAGIVLASREVVRRRSADDIVALGMPALILAQCILYLPGFERLGPAAEQRWLAERAAEETALADAVAQVPDPVLSEHMGVLAQAGRPVWLHNFVYTQLQRQGVFDPTPLVAAIREHEYPLVVERAGARVDRLDLDRWSQTVLNAIESSYVMEGDAGRWLLMRPFSLQRDSGAELSDTISLAQWDVAVNGEQTPAGPIAISPGDTLDVHLLWRADGEPQQDFTVYVHLVDWQGNRLTQSDAPPRAGTAPTSDWRDGDLVRDVHTLTVPAKAEPGAYFLDVGMYAESDGVIRQAGAPIRLPGLKMPVPTDVPESIEPLVSVGDAFGLVSLEVPKQVSPGQTLTVEASWATERTPARSLTSYLHLAGPCGDEACRLPPTAQDDHEPLDGRYPTNVWAPGEVVTTEHTLTVPAETRPGEYVLRLGWYDAGDGTRLSMASDQYRVVDDALVLPLTVEPAQ